MRSSGMRESNVNHLLISALRRDLQTGSGGRSVIPAGAFVADLGLSPASITMLMRQAAAGGLLDYSARHGAALTEAGQRRALHLLRRHRIIETYFQRALGLDWSEVHDEAIGVDEAISDRVVERMAEVLGHPTSDPHGDPIPDRDGVMPSRGMRPCCAAAHGPMGVTQACGPLTRLAAGARVRIEHIVGNDRAFLHRIGLHGLHPGAILTIRDQDAIGGTLTIQADGAGPMTLGQAAAEQIHATTLASAPA